MISGQRDAARTVCHRVSPQHQHLVFAYLGHTQATLRSARVWPGPLAVSPRTRRAPPPPTVSRASGGEGDGRPSGRRRAGRHRDGIRRIVLRSARRRSPRSGTCGPAPAPRSPSTASPGLLAPAASPAHGHGRTSAPGWSPRPAAATYSHPRPAPAAHQRPAVTAAPPPSAAAGRCRSARGSPRHTVPRDRGRCSAASDSPASVFTGPSAYSTASARQVKRQVRGRSAAASGATRTAQGSESITGCDLAAGGRAYGPGRLHRTS